MREISTIGTIGVRNRRKVRAFSPDFFVVKESIKFIKDYLK